MFPAGLVESPGTMDADLRKTARFARLKVFPAGSALLTERRKPGALYILIQGKLIVSREGKILLRLSEPGTYVGETYALLDVPSTVTVEAETDVTVIPIPADRIEDFFQRVPDQARRLAKILSQRLMDAYREIQRLKAELDKLGRIGMDVLDTHRVFSKGATREQLNQKLDEWVNAFKKLSALQEKVIQ